MLIDFFVTLTYFAKTANKTHYSNNDIKLDTVCVFITINHGIMCSLLSDGDERKAGTHPLWGWKGCRSFRLILRYHKTTKYGRQTALHSSDDSISDMTDQTSSQSALALNNIANRVVIHY